MQMYVQALAKRGAKLTAVALKSCSESASTSTATIDALRRQLASPTYSVDMLNGEVPALCYHVLPNGSDAGGFGLDSSSKHDQAAVRVSDKMPAWVLARSEGMHGRQIPPGKPSLL